MKFHSFISKEELLELLENGEVYPKEREYFYFLKKNPDVKILPNKYNYNLFIDDFDKVDFPSYDFKKEDYMSRMTGIVSEDYLIEVENITPTAVNLGWYFYELDENSDFTRCTELVIKEHLVRKYTINNVVKIYKGNFYKWKNIEELSIEEIKKELTIS